jgi:toxin YoeB
MELRLTDEAKEDIKFFTKSGQSDIVKKIEKLLSPSKKTRLPVSANQNR